MARLISSPILRTVVDVEDFNDFIFCAVDHNVRERS